MIRTMALVLALLLVLVLAPSGSGGQYSAPPPDPGFTYIFDGSATGSSASFDQWDFASGTAAQSAADNHSTIDPATGAIDPSDSSFGALWYPLRPLGDAVLRLEYMVENSPSATRNGGVIIRAPEVRYTGESTAGVLAQKPTGYNYELCPGAIPVCGLASPSTTTSYVWRGAPGPFPPASGKSDPPFVYSGPYCARGSGSLTPALNHNVSNLAGTGPLRTNGNANNDRAWAQLYCGHEIQINETLTGGGPNPSSDPAKTGSVYGFRNLNAKQSKTYQRLQKGVWHRMEIRMVGQQYTILIDGHVINQFDNSVPKIASRSGDPPTMARQLPEGYVGLQTHGGSDRILYREIQVKDLGEEDIPVNTRRPAVKGSGVLRRKLRCRKGLWSNRSGQSGGRVTWFRSNRVRPSDPHYRAPSQRDLGNFSTAPDRNGRFGSDPLTWVDSLIVGRGRSYRPGRADLGKVIHCSVAESNHGATVWETAAAPRIRRHG